jgi:hypothetical protein
METTPTSFPRHRFEQADEVPTMGHVAFERGVDDSLIVSRADLEGFLEIRSQTSSMEANLSTAPDVNAVAIDDPEDWMITTTPSDKAPLEPFNPSEKSWLIDGVGCWSNLGEPTFLPWRLEAVNLEDISLEPYAFEIGYVEPAPRPGLSKPYLPSHVAPWHPNHVSRSIAESSESVPPLTEDYSRDSDSIGNSEALPPREELLTLRTTHTVSYHEGKAPLSPQLGSIEAAFVTQFDDATLWPTLERDDYTIVPDKATSISESMHNVNGHANSELEVLEDGVSEVSVFWDDGSTDSESLWMSDYSDDVPLLEDGHPFLLIRPAVVREGLSSFQLRNHGAKGGSSNQAPGETPSSSRAAQSDTSSGRKRKREDSGTKEEEGGSGDGDDTPDKLRRTSKKDAGHQVTFACPFAKKDPVKYRSCYACILRRIGDVKQHLSRHHQLPIYCPVCMSCFDTEDQRDEHIRASSCTKRDTIKYEGVTRAQKAQLGQKVSSKLSSVDQWFTIFDILFPGHTPRPKSSYINVELTLDLEAFQDLMNAEGPNIILNVIRSRNIQMATIANEEHDLSALLLSAIEEGLQAIAQRWSESNLEEATTGVELTGSISSPLALTTDGSRRSQASSDTLIEHHREQHTTEQTRNFPIKIADHVPSDDGEAGRLLIQTSSSSQHLTSEAHQPSHDERQGTATLDESNGGQYYGETLYDAEMEDVDEFWKRFTHGDFLLAHSPENSDAAPQQFPSSVGPQ